MLYRNGALIGWNIASKFGLETLQIIKIDVNEYINKYIYLFKYIQNLYYILFEITENFWKGLFSIAVFYDYHISRISVYILGNNCTVLFIEYCLNIPDLISKNEMNIMVFFLYLFYLKLM